MLVAVILGFGLIALIDVVPLMRRKKWRAVAAFSTAFAIALTLAVLKMLNVQMPSVMYAWRDLIQWLGLAYPA